MWVRGRLTLLEYDGRLEQEWEAFRGEILASGRLRHPPGDPLSTALSELLYGTILTAPFAGDRLTTEERRATLCDVILRGLLR